MIPETEERPSGNSRKFATSIAFGGERRAHLVPRGIVSGAAPERDGAAEPRHRSTAAFAAMPPPSVA